MSKFFESDKTPWGNGKEWLVWLVALIIATLFIHNFIKYMKRKGII